MKKSNQKKNVINLALRDYTAKVDSMALDESLTIAKRFEDAPKGKIFVDKSDLR
jgi:hypothetical protein